MHIVELPSFFPPYGGEFCLEQSRALQARGHLVRVVSCQQLSIRRGLREYLGCSFRRFEEERWGVPVWRSYMRGLPKTVKWNVERWLKEVVGLFDDYVKKYGRPDVVHAHCCHWAGYAACLIKERTGIPYIITEHLSSMLYKEEFSDESLRQWEVPCLQRALKEAFRVVPVSAELVDDLAPLFGKDYQWTAISNTIDTDFFSYRNRPSVAGRQFHFCCIAHFEPLKGYDILLAAFDRAREGNKDIDLTIIGKDTNSKELRDMVSTMRHADAVHLFGMKDKEGVREVLYASDCLVLPSRSEAQPLVLLEAMSIGISVITTDRIPQSVRLEEGCFIFPVDDVEALAKEMLIAPSRTIDGKALSEKVNQLASPEVVGQRLEELLLQAHNEAAQQ